MAAGPASSVDLSNLESPEQTKLLDLIDSLRAQDIRKHVGWPQLIVCGDQSSGKSSVLNAITRLKFPAKNGVCTTFTTELRLRRGPPQPTLVSIQAGPSRTEAEKQQLSKFHAAFDSPGAFPDLIEQARNAMCRISNAKTDTIFDDVLCVDITGPHHSPLTVVDLPGLVNSTNDGQQQYEGPRIEKLVRKYMANQRSIILSVVAAPVDLALQKVLDLAKEAQHDPQRKRTLGIITKPDRVEEDMHEEHAIIQLAKNKRRPLQLGWHVLRNRSPETETSDAARDAQEEHFFNNKPGWSTLPKSDTGVHSLSKRLMKVLLDHIKTELPSLLEELEQGLALCNTQLGELGEARDTAREQAVFLHRISADFHNLTKDAINGQYASNAFFADPLSEEGFSRRLRSVIQLLNDEFRSCMDNKGHKWNILRTGTREHTHLNSGTSTRITSVSLAAPLGELFEDPASISLDDLVGHVSQLLQRNRGTEFPGSSVPAVALELFREQSERWQHIASRHAERVWNVCWQFLESVARNRARVVYDALMSRRIDPFMAGRKESLSKKLEELLSPYKNQPPVSFGNTFIELMDELENDRLVTRFKEYHKNASVENGPHTVNEVQIPLVFGRNYTLPKQNNAEVVAKYASMETVDQMKVYYKLSKDVFVSNVCSLAVENCLISTLPDIISTQYIGGLSDEELDLIAGDSAQVKFERAALNEKRSAFEAALKTMSAISRSQAVTYRSRVTPVTLPPVKKVPAEPQRKPKTPKGTTKNTSSNADITSEPVPQSKAPVGKTATATPPSPTPPSTPQETPTASSMGQPRSIFATVAPATRSTNRSRFKSTNASPGPQGPFGPSTPKPNNNLFGSLTSDTPSSEAPKTSGLFATSTPRPTSTPSASNSNVSEDEDSDL